MDLVGPFNFVDSIVNHATAPQLNGATYVKTYKINGTTYVFAASENSSGIQVLKLAGNGNLTPGRGGLRFVDGRTERDQCAGHRQGRQ
jgi:hypothetical protein